MKIKRILCAALATVFLLLTACGTQSSSSSSAPSSPSSDSGTPEGKKEIKEGPDADSGEKGTLYIVRYDRWQIKDQKIKEDKWYHYDAMLLVSCLQGILNREKPTIYVIDYNGKTSYEPYYLTYMRQEEGDLLYGYKKQNVDSFEDFLSIFGDDIKRLGLVAWDQDVPATSLVSVTACGIDGYLPVRYSTEEGSVYSQLTGALGAEVKLSLVDRFTGKGTVWGTDRKSTGSKKCDAYVWAIENYMDECDYEYAGCMLDAATVPLDGKDSPFSYDITATMVPDFDFLVYKKAFVFDLYVFEDDLPPDDLTQPLGTDRKTLIEIMQRLYDKHGGEDFTQVIGVPSIFFKYTNTEKYSHVELEFEWGRINSSYNCVIDGDCGGLFSCWNCSIYTQFELEEKYYNNKPETLPEFDENKVYVSFVMGDYDSGAWMISRAHQYFNDDALGKVPLLWPFNPNLSERIPVAFDCVYTLRTENDYFASDEGAGYAYPSWIRAMSDGKRLISGLPDASDAWVAWNKKFYDKFDMTITPFAHNGDRGMSLEDMELVARFSPDGFTSWNIPITQRSTVDGVPFCGSGYCITSEDTKIDVAIQTMKEKIDASRYPRFFSFLSNLTSPLKMAAIVNQLEKTMPEVEVVDPYTFYGLMKKAME